MHRESFIVIALTGRTGSGCTTAAQVLKTTSFSDVEFPPPQFPPAEVEERKDRIVHNWLREHWRPFQVIQVSQVILLLTLCQNTEATFDFLSGLAPNINGDALKRLLKENHEKCLGTQEVLKDLRAAENDEVTKASHFIRNELPMVSATLKEILNTALDKAYTRAFQVLGDNVRRSGNPLDVGVNPTKLLSLPETISRIIKLHRLFNKINGGGQNYFAIDALRHPYEIRYLKERISPFYTIAVTTDENTRHQRLLQLNLRKEEIEELDDKEYPTEIKPPKKRPEGYDAFVSQNIQACLENADIYISNEGTAQNRDTSHLVRQLCRYVCLMQHPGIVTPTHIERCMQVAFTAKINSGCISRQVGAVVTDPSFSIKAVGWNDVPKGQISCLLRNTKIAATKGFDDVAYSPYERGDEFQKGLKKLKYFKAQEFIGGRNNNYCFKSIYNNIKGDRNQVHTRSLHAEENAFLQISKYGGQGVEGGCLFTTASPCELCAKKAYQLGIKKIFYVDPYPGISNSHVLANGSNQPDVILFTGSIGRAYHDLYQPIMPYKDELSQIFVEKA